MMSMRIKIKSSDFKAIFPLLNNCYGFTVSEINGELLKIITQVENNSSTLNSSFSHDSSTKQVRNIPDYALGMEDSMISINTSKGFSSTIRGIKKLCSNYFKTEQDKVKTVMQILVFMAAIYDRDKHGLADSAIEDIEWITNKYNTTIREELLNLYVERHNGKKKYHNSCFIQFGGNGETLELQTKHPWFEKMIDFFLDNTLGVQSVEEAKRELDDVYAVKAGKKLDLETSRFILGTYHLLQTTPGMKSSKEMSVTNLQSLFIWEYLGIIGLISTEEIATEAISVRTRYLLKRYNSAKSLINNIKYKKIPSPEFLSILS
jgi:hypothetical protein